MRERMIPSRGGRGSRKAPSKLAQKAPQVLARLQVVWSPWLDPAGHLSGEIVARVRTRKLELKLREYGLKEVRAVRMKLKASQTLLARFMGDNTKTVSSWEQGRRKVPPMARRYLDDLVDIPVLWAISTGGAVKVK
jgi:DNA-binding transcriptional regulator YiaG